MHSINNPQNVCYVHERLSNSSNKFLKALKYLQTSSTTLDFSTSIYLNFMCLVPSFPPIDFAFLFTSFFRAENPMTSTIKL